MDKLNGQLLFLGYALHVHETRGVRARHILGTSGHVTTYLVNAHAAADGFFLNGKHTAKATTLVRTLRLYHFNAIDQLQQVNYLVVAGDVTLRR